MFSLFESLQSYQKNLLIPVNDVSTSFELFTGVGKPDHEHYYLFSVKEKLILHIGLL